MTGAQKAAFLLMIVQNVDRSLPGEILKCFSNDRIRMGVVKEITRLAAGQVSVPLDEKDQIIGDFHALVQQNALYGDWGDPTGILDDLFTGDAFTRDRKVNLIQNLLGSTPFSFLKELDPNAIWGYIQGEHPQTIALVLVCLPAEKAAALLQQISPPSMRNDVARRIATMERVMPDALEEVEEAIKAKMEGITAGQDAIQSGPAKLAQILVRLDGEMQEDLIERLRTQDIQTAEQVVENMLTFGDILFISDGDMSRNVIPGLQTSGAIDEDLPIALKGPGSEPILEKFTRNMGKRGREALMDNIDFAGQVPRREVDHARARVIEHIRGLEQAGTIIISREYGEEEEMIG